MKRHGLELSRDVATHLIRTNMLKNGKNLSDITKWMCEKFAVSANIIPVTDNSIETRIITDKGELQQEYWVKHRGRDPVEGIQYIGADKAVQILVCKRTMKVTW